ncbi:hypothetical protein PC9H_006922 [Pleurotus ostreatus]|uniref:PHD-type domain-containing protein n=1 Tax=Pleurotus ostreatus TaxID=5322 RepID=A0A8H7A1T5_PLEOS|nr:uncharacterized protein PC9H_006922 [Pleurotus ostreatus]KAF7431201.1 hypothetical protein PC9H_006922 [Pleurotus ostreatus]
MTDESATASNEPEWGRVLICGGTDWSKLGRKAAGKGDTEQAKPDLLEPHILRSLSNVKAVSVHTSCCGCHCVVLDTEGDAWLFGRNGFSALGVTGVDAVSESAPRRVKASELGGTKETKFVHAACGRNHTLLVGSEGQVWSAGANNVGQCGQTPCPEIQAFKLVSGFPAGEQIVQASAGINFSIALAKSGKVFAFGSAEKGQLGNGTTGERIMTGNKTVFDVHSDPIVIKELLGKEIVQISSGQQHTIALDSKGAVYVWGYNGYCRLGLGNQVDALKPKPVPQFAGPNEATMGAFVAAGPSNSVVVDKQSMYWMAGKWKNSGDGSSGSPYSSFRFMQDIMGCKISRATCGGVTHWALCPDDDGSTMTIAWGQNASNGELGLGPDEPKSATKPTRNNTLNGIDIFDIAAGQNTTLFLAKPNEKLSDLPRHPIDVEPPEVCIECNKDNGDDDPPLECDKCDGPYHLKCLDPPLESVPDGEWFCPECIDDPGAPMVPHPQRKAKKGRSKAKAKAKPPSKTIETEDVDEAEDDGETGGKRKASAKAKGGAAKKKRN